MLEKIKRLFKKTPHSALAATSAIGLIAIAFVSNRNRTLFSCKGRHTRK